MRAAPLALSASRKFSTAAVVGVRLLDKLTKQYLAVHSLLLETGMNS